MSFDPHEILREEAEAAFWENLPKELHEGAVQQYLGTYGDAIDARVSSLKQLAESLIDAGHYGPALASATTAIEVMIQYFCIRPIVEGAFLSELWASTLSTWIVNVRSSDQRRMLSGILKLWEIDLGSASLANNQPLWKTIHETVLPKRHAFVHRGDHITRENALLALECVSSFRLEVVESLAKKLGFTLDETGVWARIVKTNAQGLESGRSFGVRDPFSN